jgi:hypothetical protein
MICRRRQERASGLAIVGQPVEAFVGAQLTMAKVKMVVVQMYMKSRMCRDERMG